jgi:hypothetical protein
MAGASMISIQELIINTGQYLSSRFEMETALVVLPYSHGMRGHLLTGGSATTTRFSSISPAPANSPPNTVDMISTAVRLRFLILVEMDSRN